MSSHASTVAHNPRCPEPPILRDFLLGNLGEAAIEQVADHLTNCGVCDKTLRGLEGEDVLLMAVRDYLCSSGLPGPAHLSSEGSTPKAVVEFLRKRRSYPSDLMPVGKMIGPYRLLERLGAGGMGVVFKARDDRLRREAAVKLVRLGTLAGSELLDRFGKEAVALASLDHPHIVRLYDYGETDDGPYFAMEYVNGTTLATRIAAGALSPHEAAVLLKNLAGAVHYAHEQHIIHRDIKPSNVLLTAEGAPKLSDFGLAKLTNDTDGFTQTQDVLGTAAYMSPEQARGESRQVSAASDVYSLGAVLYETLTGVPPFQGTREQVKAAILTQLPIAPRRRKPALSRELEAICLKCLEKDPRRRYPTARDLAEDLDNWLEHRPTKARPERWPRKVGRFLMRRKRTCAALMLVLAGLAGGFFYRQQTDPERPRNEVKAALARGRAVDLLRSGSLPGPFRWVLGDQPELKRNQDGGIIYSTLVTSLLECTDDPMCPHFRISAELQHFSVNDTSDVGIFVAFRPVVEDGEIWYQFYTSSFAVDGLLVDRRKAPPEPYSSGVHLYLWFGPEPLSTPSKEFGRPHNFPLVNVRANPRPWRPLAVEVSPEGIKSYWQDVGAEKERLVHDVSTTKLTVMSKNNLSALPHLAKLPPDFANRGSVGIYARNGVVSVRNLKIEPLP